MFSSFGTLFLSTGRCFQFPDVIFPPPDAVFFHRTKIPPTGRCFSHRTLTPHSGCCFPAPDAKPPFAHGAALV
ncbi:hypothetical protein Q5H93_14275 [Hymenobacter sp. ASUV-10]|uniref:Secreted protein n=1 Tax=Hymenobacter aranciens TaxID=3063996 RepID=A0ABT9BGY5_9BACT|nr:hypothetical protein [Hymenobacter sp. ASUV-10]